jgi:hypothetical protein
LGWQQYTVSLANYSDWREQNSVFDQLGAMATGGMGVLTRAQGAAQIRTAFIPANLSSLLGVNPLVGRNFFPELPWTLKNHNPPPRLFFDHLSLGIPNPHESQAFEHQRFQN